MLERPVVRPDGAPRTRRSREDVVGTLPVAAVTAALWAAAVGLVAVGALVTVSWALTGRGEDGLGTPLSAAGVVWLAGHHAGVTTATATITMLPLLLLLVDLVLLFLAGRWAVRITATSTAADTALLVVAGTATYGLVGMLVAQASSLAGAAVAPLSALAWCSMAALLGLGSGALAGGPWGTDLVRRLPSWARDALLAAGAAAGALAVVVGVVAAVAVVARWSSVTSLTHQLAPGGGDAVGVLLLSLAYLPNLLVWTLAYLAGPGFAVGGGTGVDPFSQTGGLLPAAPLLGAVPDQAPAAGPLLLLLPVLVGVAAAVVLRHRRSLPLREEAIALVAGAAVLACGTAVLAALAGGALGAGRLAELGPPPLVTGLALGGLVAAGSLLVSLGTHVLPTIWVRDEH
jgi:hypothetical protein